MKRLCLCALFLVAGCDRHPAWQGWVYPDRDIRAERLPIGWFNSFAQCRAAAKADIKRIEAFTKDAPAARADYECGLNCSVVAGPRVCEKIER